MRSTPGMSRVAATTTTDTNTITAPMAAAEGGGERGGGVVGRVSRPALGDEGTEEEPPPPPDVALGDGEGGAWCGAPMPIASMKSETLSKLVEIGV